MQLKLHPDCSSAAVESIDVTVSAQARALHLAYFLRGAIAEVLIPKKVESSRTDGLWEHTCFEAFVGTPGSEAYTEFNFSPSGEWAAYSFASMRAGKRPLKIEPPLIKVEQGEDRLELRARVALPQAPLRLALSAVIEEQGGRKSYWALAHPATKPDFHHPDSFLCEL